MDINSKILVTGAAGFLGTHVRAELLRAGYRRVWGTKHSECDLLNPFHVATVLDQIKPDVVIHLAAAVGGIGANQDNPGRFFYENMQMGLNVMECARVKNVSKFINIGTVCAYPKVPPTIPFMEEGIWDGFPEETNAPYGIAKKALMLMGQGYREQYGFNCITLIPTNMYGPGDNFDPHTSHVIPAIINKVAAAQEAGQNHIRLWGTGEASREFLYVTECARAIRIAMEEYNGKEPINIGSGVEIKIKTVAKAICRQMKLGNGDYNIFYDKSKPDGQPRRALNIDRARDFGFVNRVSFKDGLAKTIEWWRENHG